MKKNVKIVIVSILVLIQSLSNANKEPGKHRGDVMGGSISSGTATFSIIDYNNMGTNEFGAMLTDFSVSNGPSGDALFESGIFFRIDGDSHEFAFKQPDSASFVGDTAVMVWDNMDDRNLFSAEYINVIEQPAPGVATLTKTLVINNLSESELSIEIFSYEDFDVAGSFFGNNAELTNDPDFITINMGVDFIEYRAGTNDSFQVSAFQVLRQLLADLLIHDLDNSGLPFTNEDFIGAFQWSADIPAFGSFTTQTTNGFYTPAPIPLDAEIILIDVIYKNGFESSSITSVR